MFANHVPGPALERALAAWGADMPEWERTLAGACDASSQRRVAERIDRSPSVINRALSKSYPGDLADLENRVRAVLGAEAVRCPAIGDEIPLAACRRHRTPVNKGQPARNHHQQLFRRHCPGCAHNLEGDAK
jgi:hypothetical protein